MIELEQVVKCYTIYSYMYEITYNLEKRRRETESTTKVDSWNIHYAQLNQVIPLMHLLYMHLMMAF